MQNRLVGLAMQGRQERRDGALGSHFCQHADQLCTLCRIDARIAHAADGLVDRVRLPQTHS